MPPRRRRALTLDVGAAVDLPRDRENALNRDEVGHRLQRYCVVYQGARAPVQVALPSGSTATPPTSFRKGLPERAFGVRFQLATMIHGPEIKAKKARSEAHLSKLRPPNPCFGKKYADATTRLPARRCQTVATQPRKGSWRRSLVMRARCRSHE
eukprot:9467235-Pyramimonas_sp.AAC.3